MKTKGGGGEGKEEWRGLIGISCVSQKPKVDWGLETRGHLISPYWQNKAGNSNKEETLFSIRFIKTSTSLRMTLSMPRKAITHLLLGEAFGPPNL